jgi:hypothetical protein
MADKIVHYYPMGIMSLETVPSFLRLIIIRFGPSLLMIDATDIHSAYPG